MTEALVEEKPFQLREHSIKAKDLIEHMDGRGAILTDDDLLNETLAEHGLRPDTWLMVVPEEMFCLIIRRGQMLRSCSVYDSELKAEQAFVTIMSRNDEFEQVAETLNGDHKHDYRVMLEAVEQHDWYGFDIQQIHEIE